MLFVASLDDQVVPVYSGLFTSVSHPLIMRALYIDGDAYTCDLAHARVCSLVLMQTS